MALLQTGHQGAGYITVHSDKLHGVTLAEPLHSHLWIKYYIFCIQHLQHANILNRLTISKGCPGHRVVINPWFKANRHHVLFSKSDAAVK